MCPNPEERTGGGIITKDTRRNFTYSPNTTHSHGPYVMSVSSIPDVYVPDIASALIRDGSYGEASFKGLIVQWKHRSREASFKGRIVQETLCLETQRSGTNFDIAPMLHVSLKGSVFCASSDRNVSEYA
jgi:hypothetical protein